MRVAHVSTFPPLRCGIASFVNDLMLAVKEVQHYRYVLHYGSEPEIEAMGAADVRSLDQLAACGRTISGSDADVVSLQHEFGIWGGAEGEYIHSFLDQLTKPLLSVLHTTFGPGTRTQAQAETILRIVRQSRVVVVLTEAAKRSTEQLCGGQLDHVVVIPHGIPEVAYVPPPPAWRQEGRRQSLPVRMITPGFFRPDKGLDTILYAIHDLKVRGYDIRYRIAGEAQLQFSGQAAYLARVKGLIEALDLTGVVSVDNRYLSFSEQAEAIQAAHLGVFCYQDPTHASSGTVPLVLSMGRPVLCTPFEYANAKEHEVPGVFVAKGFDRRAIADAIEAFMRLEECLSISKSAYDRTRSWRWPAVGTRVRQLYESAALGNR